MNMNIDIGYVRDKSGALINKDMTKYLDIIRRRKEIKDGQEICNRMNVLESELQEIKKLLLQVLNK